MTLEEFAINVKTLRDNFSEEIPSTIVHSTNPKFKVRKAWIHCVGAAMVEGIRNGYLPKEYAPRYREFYERNRKTGLNERDTTREDIDYSNRVLDDILKFLEK